MIWQKGDFFILQRLAREKGMTRISRQTGLAREHLYAVLSENGNPTLDTLLKILEALGLEMEIREKRK